MVTLVVSFRTACLGWYFNQAQAIDLAEREGFEPSKGF